jgi:hypothetical protein
VWKLGEISQTIEQSKIFRDFFDSERTNAWKKLTKKARVKTRGRFYTASADTSGPCTPTFPDEWRRSDKAADDGARKRREPGG